MLIHVERWCFETGLLKAIIMSGMADASECALSVIDVAAFVDEQPIGRFQIRLLLACATVLLLDGFDTQGIGDVAPELAHDWNLARVTEGVRAAALWLPPDVEPDHAAMGALMEESLRPEIAEDLGSVMKSMAEHHPNQPHWYLPLIAADPNWIGQGLGALLMKHALRRCDEEGIPAYLESSNPRNISLYERLGFNIVGKIQCGLFSGDDANAPASIWNVRLTSILSGHGDNCPAD